MLADLLEKAKAQAVDTQTTCMIEVGGIQMEVAPSGGTGGYTYRFDTGSLGATWFVKKPGPNDPWGVRVSCKSRPLALLGLEAVRADIEDTISQLGLYVPAEGVSIGRVDYAIDILHPSFVLDPRNFVAWGRTKIGTQEDLSEQRATGRSGRFTSVTVGKMPGRQVIVYDKREEALVKRKHEWPFIWDKALTDLGHPPLDMSDAGQSRVWRIELRLGKLALKDRAGIRGWSSFYRGLQAQLVELTEAVELCLPCADSNRARWLPDPAWTLAKDFIADGVFRDPLPIDQEVIHEAVLLDKQREFLGLASSHLVTLAVLEGVNIDDFSEFLEHMPGRIEHFLDMHKRGLDDRMSDAATKYGSMIE